MRDIGRKRERQTRAKQKEKEGGEKDIQNLIDKQKEGKKNRLTSTVSSGLDVHQVCLFIQTTQRPKNQKRKDKKRTG